MKFLNRVWTSVRSVINFKVSHWHVCMGQEDGDNTNVSVRLEEDIWYWHMLNTIAWDWLLRICDWLSHVNLPKFICKWKRQWGKSSDPEWDDDDVYTLEEYWGGDLGGFWHSWVENPICQWTFRHTNRKLIIFDLTLAEARKKFEHFPHKLEWIEKEVVEREKEKDSMAIMTHTA